MTNIAGRRAARAALRRLRRRAPRSRGVVARRVVLGWVYYSASIDRSIPSIVVDASRRRANAIAKDGEASSVESTDIRRAPPSSRSRRSFVRSLARSRPLVLSSPERFVQTRENLRSVSFTAVHRAQESSHAVVAPIFPFVKVSLCLENPSHAARFRRREPRARDELAGAEESTQSNGSTDGGEDRVHLRAREDGTSSVVVIV